MDPRTHILFGLALIALPSAACDGESGEGGEGGDTQALDKDKPGNMDEAPKAEDLWVEGVVYDGAGCPDPDSVQVGFAPDKMSFFVSFNDMLLINPAKSPIQTTNCVISAQLHVPDGWQVGVTAVDGYGYALLEEGVKARNTGSYFFAGEPVGYETETSLEGSYDSIYSKDENVEAQSIVWSECGASTIFAINNSLVLNAIAAPQEQAIFSSIYAGIELQSKKC
ncbi:DUF4360 domain-containing protein [Enhygromyxa salina]|nr:DUF4360 domain-containing protein [Enhygromyxa salina]